MLGAGGLISVLAASRARLRLVAVTDGERSHLGHAIHSGHHQAEEAPDEVVRALLQFLG
jgi:LmbE family N-acetylglucosaminyl deacetylase